MANREGCLNVGDVVMWEPDRSARLEYGLNTLMRARIG